MLAKADLASPVSKEIESCLVVLEIAQNWACLRYVEMQRSVGNSGLPVMTSWASSGVLSSFPWQKSAPFGETSPPMSFFIVKPLRPQVALAVLVALEVEVVLVVSVLVASLVVDVVVSAVDVLLVRVVVSEDVLVSEDVVVSEDVGVLVDVGVPVEDGVASSPLGISLAP